MKDYLGVVPDSESQCSVLVLDREKQINSRMCQTNSGWLRKINPKQRQVLGLKSTVYFLFVFWSVDLTVHIYSNQSPQNLQTARK